MEGRQAVVMESSDGECGAPVQRARARGALRPLGGYTRDAPRAAAAAAAAAARSRAKGRLQARATRLKKIRLMSSLTTMIEGLQ